MGLKILFIVHALITAAAALVLLLFPPLIPQMVNIHLDKSAYLLSYLLGTAELSIAMLSFSSRNVTDHNTVRLVCFTLIVFHLTTAIAEIAAFFQGVSSALLANVALRFIIAVLFSYYGWYKMKHKTKSFSGS